MGVIYKLKDEVVQFIITQRQGNPLSSCRQLAELASQKFGVQLSKSSVHDVLKESGIMTPRGRKPKAKFEIPQEKKKQIQENLSKVKLLPAPEAIQTKLPDIIRPPIEPAIAIIPPIETIEPNGPNELNEPVIVQATTPPVIIIEQKSQDNSIVSPEYEGAGRVFLKAAIWDLGIFPPQEEGPQQGQKTEPEGLNLPDLKGRDWDYYLTYCKGIKVTLENNKDFFVDLPLPIERCIREVSDGLINNIRPFIGHKVSDEVLFKASMSGQTGNKMIKVSIVGQDNRLMLEFDHIVEHNRTFIANNIVFVENYEKNFLERAKTVFFPQTIDNISFIDEILNLKGFDTTQLGENIVTLLIEDSYSNKRMLQEAADKLNDMYLRDEQNRLVKVKIQDIPKPI